MNGATDNTSACALPHLDINNCRHIQGMVMKNSLSNLQLMFKHRIYRVPWHLGHGPATISENHKKTHQINLGKVIPNRRKNVPAF